MENSYIILESNGDVYELGMEGNEGELIDMVLTFLKENEKFAYIIGVAYREYNTELNGFSAN